MLKKLLKYDLADLNKVLVVFYILAIIFALITRVLFSFENSTMLKIFAQIASGTVIAMIANIIINNLMRVWARFRKNCYGDEAYLTHTLPVSKSKIYLSKTLASVISLFTSFIVIVLTLFIAYYSKENFEVLKNILLNLVNNSAGNVWTLLILLFSLLFAEFVLILQVGFTGLIIGHKSNNNKIFKSVLFGLIAYGILETILVVGLLIAGLFNNNIMQLFTSNVNPSIELLKTTLIIGIVIYAISFFIYYFVNNKLFTKGVNVD